MSKTLYQINCERYPGFKERCNELQKAWYKTPKGKVAQKRERVRKTEEIRALKAFAASKGWRYSKVQRKMMRIE